MIDFWKLVAITGGLMGLAAFIGAVARMVRAAVKAEEAVADVPKLRADLEAFKVSLRAETRSEAEKIEAKMDSRFATLEKENNQRMEQIQHSVDARFEQVIHSLGGLERGMSETLASIEKQMAVVGNNVEWLKRTANSGPPHDRDR
jgi:DNA anti-recombination protein RmuC